MRSIANDRWEAEFAVEELGRYVYTIVAWVDAYRTWALDLAKRVKASVDISVDALHGVKLLQAAASRAKGVDKQELTYAAERLRELSREDPKMAPQSDCASCHAKIRKWRPSSRRTAICWSSPPAIVISARKCGTKGNWVLLLTR